MSKIIRLSVRNLLRIHAAEINPDGSLVIVAGRNDQGKSSLLNCIAIALSGKNLPAEPIRRGATSGEVVLETEQYIITRKFSASGGGQLIVKDRDGCQVTSPQTKLDDLYTLTTFDPLTFTRQDGKTQAATVRELAGLDTTALDNEYQKLFAERTEANRHVRDQHGRMSTIPRNPEAPAKLIEIDDLTEQLRAAMTHNQQVDRDSELLSVMNDRIDSMQSNLAVTRSEYARIKLSIEQQEAGIAAETQARDHQKANVEKAEPISLEEITAKISQAESVNAQIRDNARWSEEQKRLIELEKTASALTERLQKILEDKRLKTEQAKFPIAGLGFNDVGVTFESFPFEQISSSKKIRVSLAIACALNPNLRVMLIRDGSWLDAESLELVRTFAEQHKAQVFMECVGQREDATVIIEDGTVVATPVATKKSKSTR